MSGFEDFDWTSQVCPVCTHRISYHHATSLCQECVGYEQNPARCLEADPIQLAKIRVYRETRTEQAMSWHMWKGGCTACFTTMQYWGAGATLGAMLEHIRRCSRFRYAMSLDPTYQSGISLRQRLSSSSGRQRSGGTDSSRPQPSVPPFSLPELKFNLPAGFKALGEAINTPFGRCKDCNTPRSLRAVKHLDGSVKLLPVCPNGHSR